ncbi:unnamed protein product [Angiostrongylus costaricensis]|uniref:Transposase n=1 Tax=Angiostrongylus costaricensis TaxID=334426 RepID=A0A0R3PW99_ANGCS|nr:unnamed protein product [Angiostrongylus costaricensis]
MKDCKHQRYRMRTRKDDVGSTRVTQVQERIRSPGQRRRSQFKDAVLYANPVADKVDWTRSGYERQLIANDR